VEEERAEPPCVLDGHRLVEAQRLLKLLAAHLARADVVLRQHEVDDVARDEAHRHEDDEAGEEQGRREREDAAQQIAPHGSALIRPGAAADGRRDRRRDRLHGVTPHAPAIWRPASSASVTTQKPPAPCQHVVAPVSGASSR
jgi:hypothetical protein